MLLWKVVYLIALPGLCNYDITTSPIRRSYRGFEKTEEALWGEDRVHYQRLDVILDDGLIEFAGMDY